MSDEAHWNTFKYHMEQIEMQVGSAERGRRSPGSLLGFVGEVEFQLESIKELAEKWEEEQEDLMDAAAHVHDEALVAAGLFDDD